MLEPSPAEGQQLITGLHRHIHTHVTPTDNQGCQLARQAVSLSETGTDGEDSGTLNLPSFAMALDAVVWSCVSYV